MNTIMQYVKQFLNDEEGVTAIEYGLIAALIAAVIAGVVKLTGTHVQSVFTAINTALTSAL